MNDRVSLLCFPAYRKKCCWSYRCSHSVPVLKGKLIELGLVLPHVSAPLAAYVPARISGNLIYISGQLPMRDGALMRTGALQTEEEVEEGQEAMAQCFLNGLAAASLVTDLDRIQGVLRLGAFVSSGPEFIWQHLVANGASHLAERIFGEKGKHVRAAVGVPVLPLNASVELELILEQSPQ